MAKLIFYLAITAVTLICVVDCRTCKQVGEKCKTKYDCFSGKCQGRRCVENDDDDRRIRRASHHSRLGDMKRTGIETRTNGIRGENYRWPDANVPYELDPAFTSDEKALIKKSFDAISSGTCVDFKKRKNEKDYIYYRRDGPDGGCYSDVGRQGGKQVLNLGVGEDSTCMDQTIIVHETLHGLGFHHEMNRFDRDDYVSINWDNIACGEQFNFYKDNLTSTETFGLPYDYASIMHYWANEGGIDPKLPTIIPKVPGTKISGETLTELDILSINRMYKCLPPTSV